MSNDKDQSPAGLVAGAGPGNRSMAAAHQPVNAGADVGDEVSIPSSPDVTSSSLAAQADAEGLGSTPAPNDDDPVDDADISMDDDGHAERDQSPADADALRAEIAATRTARDRQRQLKREAEQRAESLQHQVTELSTKLKTVTDAFAALRRSRIEEQIAQHLSFPRERVGRYADMAVEDGIMDAGDDLHRWCMKSLPVRGGGVLHGPPNPAGRWRTVNSSNPGGKVI